MFCGALSVKPRSMDCSVQRPKKLKTVRNVATSPLPPLYTPKEAYIDLGMWGRMLDVINHAKNRYLPLTGGIALTTLVHIFAYPHTNIGLHP